MFEFLSLQTKRFFARSFIEPNTKEEVNSTLSQFPLTGVVHVYPSLIRLKGEVRKRIN